MFSEQDFSSEEKAVFSNLEQFLSLAKVRKDKDQKRLNTAKRNQQLLAILKERKIRIPSWNKDFK